MPERAIVCVDDDPIIVLALKQELRQRFGGVYVYEGANSGPEGLELVDALFVEGVSVILVLSDWQMPGMRGDEFLREIQARHPGIPAILLTGQADPASIQSAYDRGIIAAHLQKPWDRKVLAELIARILG